MREVPVEKLKKFIEYDKHSKVYRLEDKKVGLIGFIAIHRKTDRVPALGATRLWKYGSEEDALRDALRLSCLMSYKSALAGLPYTGGKAVLIWNESIENNREEFFNSYADCVNSLKGEFVTGTDVGVYDSDVTTMSKKTDYVIGRGVNPGYFTALGILYSIETALNKVYGSESLEGKTFAVQGLGKTGLGLIKLLYNKVAKIIATDINKETIKKVTAEFPNIEMVEPDEIYSQVVDVFSPCALNGVLNEDTIGKLKCKIICGSANNQLNDELIGEKLNKLNILYVPDYVANSGGLISVADEFEYGVHSEDRINKKLLAIKTSLKSIFDESDDENEATNIVANKIAEEIISSK
ncbi:MAG: Glu/Leu/Phe/Val dehydrogenase dimerization domain-containing protein [bacterium]|nr:Glu/Leu/Phe/Val dehydrogenase dimerization domain-containing protein [bacterium]